MLIPLGKKERLALSYLILNADYRDVEALLADLKIDKAKGLPFLINLERKINPPK